MFNNLNPSDRAGIVGMIDPDAYTASTVTTGWIDARAFHSFMAIVMAGTLGASATLDAKIEQASDSGGTGAKDVTGLAITQLTQAGTDSDKQAIINIDPHKDLDRNNGFDYFRLSMTVATATSDAGGVVLGFNPRNGGATANDAATVDEVVS
jgi:hypothetical protein